MNRPARLNRTLLAVLGVVLLAVGGFGLAAGLGFVPGADPTVPLLPAGITFPPWVPWVAAAVAVVVGLACLRWLLAQTMRRARTGTWSLHSGDTGSTRVDADVAAHAVEADIEAYPGVRSVTATLAGHRSAPSLQLEITTEEHTPVGALRDRIGLHALPRLRQSMELDEIPTELLLHVDAARSTAVRAR